MLTEIWPQFVRAADRYVRKYEDQDSVTNTKEIEERVLPKILFNFDPMDKIHPLLQVNDPNGGYKWTEVFQEVRYGLYVML
ncbi:MAG: hypothetical protein IEMM0008_1883 [bacterium]|nr:MAG: hypothetical protein IEMM0008_1883 [bacterium]